MTTKIKTFFLDRDGTINIDYNYVHTPEEWAWCDGAVEAIRWMNNNGFKVIIITNQSGIMKGRYTMDDVDKLHKWVEGELQKYGVHIDGWYVAPWHPDYHEGYDPALLRERKPGTGLFEQAAKKFNIDFSRSYMAGDKITDLEPALELGIKPFMIKSRFWELQDQQWIKDQGIDVFDDIGEVVGYLDMVSAECSRDYPE